MFTDSDEEMKKYFLDFLKRVSWRYVQNLEPDLDGYLELFHLKYFEYLYLRKNILTKELKKFILEWVDSTDYPAYFFLLESSQMLKNYKENQSSLL